MDELLQTTSDQLLSATKELSVLIPYLPIATRIDLSTVHDRCQALATAIKPPGRPTFLSELLSLAKCYLEIYNIASIGLERGEIERAIQQLDSIQVDRIPPKDKTDGVPASRRICKRRLEHEPYVLIQAEAKSIWELGLSSVAALVTPAQDELSILLNHQDTEVTESVLQSLTDFSELIRCVKEEDIPLTCKSAMIGYIAICRAFGKVIDTREHGTDFLTWWQALPYPGLLELFQRGILVTGGLLDDEDGLVLQSYILLAKRIQLVSGQVQTSQILRTGMEN